VTVHYHGTPITPVAALYELVGRCFCVSFADPRDVERCHQIGQSVMIDNGAFSLWKANIPTDWPAYYRWVERWLGYATTWAVIPDHIDAGAQVQDALLREWPYGHRGAPVWHMDEPIERMLALCDAWPRVCIGSTSVYSVVLSDSWRGRLDEVFNALAQRHRFMPWIHMLRGMQALSGPWPFASADSTDVAQSHWRPQNTPRSLADRWDQVQCPGGWAPRLKKQMVLL
jgi:hypothetical protein